MTNHPLAFLGVVLAPFLIAQTSSAAVVVSYAGVSADGDAVSFEADFSISGDALTVRLLNTSPFSSASRDDCLSSFYFDIVRNGLRPTLSYVGAIGDVWLTSKRLPDTLVTADADLKAVERGDGTWQFKTFNPDPLFDYAFGLGTVGNSALGPYRFDGDIVGGRGHGPSAGQLPYSIYAGDVTTRSLGNLYLVKDSATFTFSGIGGFTEDDIERNCVFGMGTSPSSLVVGHNPEPSAVVGLLGMGAMGLVATWRKRRRQAA